MQAQPSLIGAAKARRTHWFLGVGWAVIVLKCLAVPWVIDRWQVPVQPGWVIVPTILFAALVTLVVLASREN